MIFIIIYDIFINEIVFNIVEIFVEMWVWWLLNKLICILEIKLFVIWELFFVILMCMVVFWYIVVCLESFS